MFIIPAEGDNAGLVASVFDKETLGPPRMIGQVHHLLAVTIRLIRYACGGVA